MQREIWMTDLNPAQGSEQSGVRPVVIVSGDIMNKFYSVVIICPLTSRLKNYRGCPVIQPDKLNKLKLSSQIIPFQIRTIAKSRLKKKIGLISEDILDQVKDGINIYLNY
ncbi:MAG: type II toxin-antitoxin system PemK/MazF family toxin [Chitinophagaceae bacterium]